MKLCRSIALIFFMVFAIPSIAQEVSLDCTPEVVAEWMIQRQIGRNRIQTALSDEAQMSVREALLLVQQVRRDLEDIPRPQCADKLYILTMYFYGALSDSLTFNLLNDTASHSTISQPRIDRYGQTVEPMYEELEAIAGIDVMAEASLRQPVPTAVPTTVVVEPFEYNGTDATVIGPVEIPAGIYRTILTIERYASVSVTPTQGECGAGSSFLTPGLFIIMQGQATNGAEAIFTSRGCTALIEVSNVQAAWKLRFEKVG